uniref:Uncharacterized protein n=1 Tax=Panagrolaimus sp. JU765 TaxID=591449 RepID=A0AC34Q4B5_9BILA
MDDILRYGNKKVMIISLYYEKISCLNASNKAELNATKRRAKEEIKRRVQAAFQSCPKNIDSTISQIKNKAYRICGNIDELLPEHRVVIQNEYPETIHGIGTSPLGFDDIGKVHLSALPEFFTVSQKSF